MRNPVCLRRSLALVAILATFVGPISAQDADTAKKKADSPNLAKVKQEEALRGLKRLEETMEKLARLLERKEPHNASKLDAAFLISRRQQIRESMTKILVLIAEKKYDRAQDLQKQVGDDLQAMLDVLLDKEVSPRELLKHIRNLRKVLKDIDTVVEEQTSEKLASDDADQAGADSAELKKTLQQLEDAIRK